MSSITAEQITAALKKLGPVSPGELYEHLDTTARVAGPIVKDMLSANELKAVGVTKSRRIALPDQKFDESGAPPQRRQPKAGKKKRRASKGKKAKRAARTPRAAAPAPAHERFIPTVDAEKNLVIVNGAEPLVFNDVQTAAIATLLLQHYG